MIAKFKSPPSAGKWFKNAFRSSRNNFLAYSLFLIIFLVMLFVSLLPQFLITGFQSLSSPEDILRQSLVPWIIYMLLAPAIWAGLLFTFIKAAQGRNLELGYVFEGFRNYFRFMGVCIPLFGGITVIEVACFMPGILIFGPSSPMTMLMGIALCAVPVTYVGMGMFMAPCLVVDQKMGVIDSFKTSWRMTNGFKGQLFLMFVFIWLLIIALYIPVVVMALIPTVLGCLSAIVPIFMLLYAIPVYLFMGMMMFMGPAEAYVDLHRLDYEQHGKQEEESEPNWNESLDEGEAESVPLVDENGNVSYSTAQKQEEQGGYLDSLIAGQHGAKFENDEEPEIDIGGEVKTFARKLQEMSSRSTRAYFLIGNGTERNKTGISTILPGGKAQKFLAEIRGMLPQGYISFLSDVSPADGGKEFVQLVIARGITSFDIPSRTRTSIPGTKISFGKVMDQIVAWDNTYGVDIFYASKHELRLKLLENPVNVDQVVSEIEKISPASIENAGSEKALSYALKTSRIIVLSWD